MASWPAQSETLFAKRDAADRPADKRTRIVNLVAKYPNVSAAEAAEILKHIRTARYVEIERLASDETVRAQLQHFFANHRDQLRFGPIEIVTAIALVVAFLAICWLLWNSIGGA